MQSPSIDDVISLEECLFNISNYDSNEVAAEISDKWDNLKDHINSILPAAINQRRFSYEQFANVIKALPKFNRLLLNFDMQIYLRNIESTDETFNLSLNIFPEGSIGYAIIHDDVDSVIEFSLSPKFFDLKVSFCEADSWTAEIFSLIDAAAYFGSYNVFRFLYVNGFKITEETVKRSIYGGNIEIAELISQEGFSFAKYIKDAIICHRNEIAIWIIEQNDEVELDFDLCLRCRNTFLVKYIIESGVYNDSFMERAVLRRRRDVLQYLIDNGYDNSDSDHELEQVYYNM
ncbi:hypothetical protein TVAG_222170 [Trichomonas vaginalis G3]|uniref:DUF3447 domain-containing protein n=1 Tax=Trichomonas vaginalis (strain ATCC PRA-98 / G3) TaxID=412133 RepID=A2GFX4_TRIV3|nr:protein ubiquitination [Trichomonas vaginalis G3]EAX83942.1 hypothetical protein TVAG_222170 [Trichomonas vaginalis G3]KAI5502368.1 protein ubiquitination [Trichomonas vaginalis G3]|eukprot:XP_001296872.1 hypothetical protein [Trichomonas vaginalis G3]